MEGSPGAGTGRANGDLLIRLEAARYTYPGADKGAPVLGPFSIDIAPAEMIGVVGRSGSGKSTLLGLLAGLLVPDQGRRWVSSEYGGAAFVLQTHAVHPYLTAWENVATAWGVPRTARREPAVRVLRALDLDTLADRRADRLSGGQQQRLAIARAIASKSSVVIADEPTGSLDALSTAIVLDVLEAVARNGRTVVVATHDDQVRARCSRVVTLAQDPAS